MSSSDSDADMEDEQYQDGAAAGGAGKRGRAGAAGRGQQSKGSKKQKERELVNVDFNFCDPGDADFHAVRGLLSQGTLGPVLGSHIGNLAATITEQKGVGTIIKVDDGTSTGMDSDDATVVAFMTVLPLRNFRQTPAGAALVAALRRHCPREASSGLDALLAEPPSSHNARPSRTVGIFVSEKLINAPPQLAGPLLQVLLEDMDWVKHNAHEAGCEPDTYDFHTLLMIAPCFPASGAEASDAAAGPGTAAPDPNASPDFVHYEDEIIAKFASVSYVFPLPGSKEARGDKPSHAAVLAFPAARLQVVAEAASRARFEAFA